MISCGRQLLYNYGITTQCTTLNENRSVIPNLELVHGAMEDCKRSLFTTNWFDCNNASVIQKQPTTSSFIGNSKQVLWVGNSSHLNDGQRIKKYKQNEQSSMNHDILAITNEQRTSVIKWARKEDYFGRAVYNIPFVNEPSSIMDVSNCHENSCNRKHEEDQTPFSFRTFTQTDPTVSTKTDTSRPNSQNKEYKYNCRFCGKLFQWNSHWQSHERIHTGEKPYKCDECGKAFTRSDGLQCHKVIHLNKRSSDFPNEEKANHMEENPVPYEQLVGAVDDEDRFGPEIIRVNNKNFFKCRFCQRVHSSSTSFLKHVQRHKGKYVFKCDTCHKAFSKQSALEIHNRIHTGARPYQCNTCTKAFSIYGNLRRHLIIHTGKRPYTCSKCRRSFNNPSHLTRHIKNKHVVPNSSA